MNLPTTRGGGVGALIRTSDPEREGWKQMLCKAPCFPAPTDSHLRGLLQDKLHPRG